MTNTELQTRIDKVLIKLEKIDKRISKWEGKKNQDAFIKDQAPWYSREPKTIKTMEDLVVARFNSIDSKYYPDSMEYTRKYISEEYNSHLEHCDKEIKYAIRDREDQLTLINKYKNMMALNDEKHSKPVIQIVKDFFENWKAYIITYAKGRLDEYRAADKALCEDYNTTPYEIRKTLEWKTKHNAQYKEARAILTGWVKELYDRGNDGFLKFMDKYMEDRYFELVNKVTDITGEITDITRLYVANDGSLNGVIIGENGTAKVETIVAGGYNIQCLHYRVLVHSLKR